MTETDYGFDYEVYKGPLSKVENIFDEQIWPHIAGNDSYEEIWETDYSRDQNRPVVKFGDIPPHDKLKFAKRIMIFLFIIFLIILVVTYCFPNNPQTEKVWSFTSGAINSIVGILIGYYFTSK